MEYTNEDHSISEVCKGMDPRWSPDGKKFLFHKDILKDTLYCYSLITKQEEVLLPSILSYRWSPSEKNIAAIIWSRTTSLTGGRGGKLVIINRRNPNLKFIIEGSVGKFKWIK